MILGIDIGNKQSQICFYDKTSHTAESIPFVGSTLILENPVTLDRIFENVDQGMPVDMDELMSQLSFLIDTARRKTGEIVIEKMAITVDSFQSMYLDAIKVAFQRMAFDLEDIIFLSHEECFAYYAYRQKKELWNGGVALLDYNEKELFGCFMTNIAAGGKDVIVEDSHSTVNDELNAMLTDKGKLEDVESHLVDMAIALFNKRVVSSVYLTGIGFDTDKLPNTFLQTICQKRRVFAGQNLYVKGACYAAVEEYKPEYFNNTIFACNNRITTGIEMGIVERGSNKIFKVVKPGINWYLASRTVNFIVDDCDKIILNMLPVGNQGNYEEVIDLSEFPYRTDKTTRISMEFAFAGDDRCMVTVKDRGFGEIARSSGKVIYKDLDLEIKER